MNRRKFVEELKKQSEIVWDIIVIGGGATGLGIALDGASRGYKTLLLEQSDFAKGNLIAQHKTGSWRCAIYGPGRSVSCYGSFA